MIKLKSLLKENTDDVDDVSPFDLPENKDLLQKIYAAAVTQRGDPEHTMLEAQRIIQKAHGSNVLVNSIEHTGDLSHRAQVYNAIINVDEKITMMLRYWSPNRWTLDKEIKDGIEQTCLYTYMNSSNQYESWKEIRPFEKRNKIWNDLKLSPQVQSLIKHAYEETDRALKMYVDSHRKYNKPITKLGLLGKNAAIALGELKYDELHKILLEMRQWVDTYNSSDKKTQFAMFTELI